MNMMRCTGGIDVTLSEVGFGAFVLLMHYLLILVIPLIKEQMVLLWD